MLLESHQIRSALAQHDITVTGVLHVGAHHCQELRLYTELGVSPFDVVWIEALPQKVVRAMLRGIPNIYPAVITDQDDQAVSFNISNNVVSSSVLPLAEHAEIYPDVKFVGEMKARTLTLDTFFRRHNVDCTRRNFWSMDIQGAELMALRGATSSLRHVQALCLEVSRRQLYAGSPVIEELEAHLAPLGFTRALLSMTEFGWGDALYLRA